ncbi:hypothetical protein MUK42_33993 [Musa troglodytarum]|uniref:Uncharacterized protein n=1 Tax=Musa troglodytarum TaxID=320322 RepID=A0A9E7F8X6_9LILI|nr:hypothetical protein MUK42_33993 [Musa troglodytarum]
MDDRGERRAVWTAKASLRESRQKTASTRRRSRRPHWKRKLGPKPKSGWTGPTNGHDCLT